MTQRFEEAVPIGSLTPHPNNPRRGDMSAIRASIDANGFYGGVVAQESTRRILVGNHRWKAERDAGKETIPVFFLQVDDDEAEEIMVADNRLSDLATYHLERLRNALLKVDRAKVQAAGYRDEQAAAILGELAASRGGSTAPTGRTPENRRTDYVNATHGRRLVLVYELDDYARVGSAMEAYAKRHNLAGQSEALAHALGVL